MGNDLIIANTETLIPAQVAAAGEQAAIRFIEFFTANIRNPNTRAAPPGRRPVVEHPDRCQVLFDAWGCTGREGHILIVEEIEDEEVVVHDPAPNGGLGVRIPRKLFEKAWTSPAETMANYISVWRRTQ